MRRPTLATALVVTLATVCVRDAAAQTEIRIFPRSAATLTVGGRVHTQLQASSVAGAPMDVFLRRARLRLDIEVSDFLDARFNPDFAGGETSLKDVYVRLSFDDAFKVSFGQFKRAFSVFELASSTDLPVIERDGRIAGLSTCAAVGGVCSFSRLTEKLSFDGRDQGIRVEGALGSFSYSATVTNGEGTNVGDVNDEKSFSGRLSYDLGAARVGVFSGVHDYPVTPEAGGQDTDLAEALGFDIEIGTWRKGYHVMAAVATGDNWRTERPGSRFATFQALGSFYFPVDSDRMDGVEPLLRVGWADPDDDADDDAGLLVTPGVMLYFTGKNGVSLNVDSYLPQGDASGELSFKLQTYLYF